MDCSPPGSSVHGILQARILEWVAFPFSRGSSQPRIEPRSPALQADSLPAEPQGKPKNTGVGSLSLLQLIFLTQELNWGLLHCRRILYQLKHEASPICRLGNFKLFSLSLNGNHQQELTNLTFYKERSGPQAPGPSDCMASAPSCPHPGHWVSAPGLHSGLPRLHPTPTLCSLYVGQAT